MIGLTLRQTECLGHIQKISADGLSPSVEELRQRMGLASKSGITRLLGGLEERGLITRIPHKARSISLVQPQLPTAAEMTTMPRNKLRRHLRELVGALAGKSGNFDALRDVEACARALREMTAGRS